MGDRWALPPRLPASPSLTPRCRPVTCEVSERRHPGAAEEGAAEEEAQQQPQQQPLPAGPYLWAAWAQPRVPSPHGSGRRGGSPAASHGAAGAATTWGCPREQQQEEEEEGGAAPEGEGEGQGKGSSAAPRPALPSARIARAGLPQGRRHLARPPPALPTPLRAVLGAGASLLAAGRRSAFTPRVLRFPVVFHPSSTV